MILFRGKKLPELLARAQNLQLFHITRVYRKNMRWHVETKRRGEW